MELVANLFSFAGHLIDVIVGFKYNEKSKIVLFNIISSTCSLLAMYLLNSMAGCISVTVTIFRLVFIYLKDKYLWKVDWMFFIFLIGYGSVFFDNNLIVALFMFLGNIIAFSSKWFLKKAQHLRIGVCTANIIFIFPNIFIHNFSAVPFYLFNAVLITLAYIKWYKYEKEQKKV